jgi:hypothetical protein
MHKQHWSEWLCHESKNEESMLHTRRNISSVLKSMVGNASFAKHTISSNIKPQHMIPILVLSQVTIQTTNCLLKWEECCYLAIQTVGCCEWKEANTGLSNIFRCHDWLHDCHHDCYTDKTRRRQNSNTLSLMSKLCYLSIITLQIS